MDRIEFFTSHPDFLWVNEVLTITLFSSVAWIVWRLFIGRLERHTSDSAESRVHAIIHSIKTPISTLIWLWPGTISLGLILGNYFDYSLNFLDTTKHALVVFTLAWISYRLSTNIEINVIARGKHDATTINGIGKLSRMIIIVIGLVSVLQSMGLSLSGVMTMGGVGGLVAGFAAKDLLSNFFGGWMIYFDKPFKVGDWIRSPDRSIEGTVERIGWRMSVIRTFDKRPLYIPNAIFSSIVVENPSRMTNRRIKETIGIRYDDAEKMHTIIKAVKQMLRNHPAIDTRQTMIVNFDSFGPSSLDFFIYTFTKTVNWIEFHEVKQDVLLKVIQIIHQQGADVAFPTQTLKIDPAAEPEISNIVR
ncbi:mechanosensitive ion channel family protein [Vibrio ulleungensis]|uniref:Mechanosensitive ion channel family protein n=1 Tax=Vibrio ulleungensis TaxID=2807619 RepID=A0ABS2HI15_9VIBR|nr:mechanosensitive ion channel family protein [Vibrio ulleungensis]MBM7035472.1 mechanosensitive ion channel family protein [Vibrio ulleungensis]